MEPPAAAHSAEPPSVHPRAAEEEAAPSAGPQPPPSAGRAPTACIVVGMAGSGKTTLMQRLNLHAAERGTRGYFVNLDPAAMQVPFAAGVDIRDTVNYKEVMKQYGLGPNGGILTSLNLFSTRFDQVLAILERRAQEGLQHVFIDTPGQIEVFTWSASGQIITESLALQYPTVLLFVVDTVRTQNPTTFMSNMLYACSMLYKTHLPLVVVFNKTDVTPANFAFEWMEDYDKFQDAMDELHDDTYMGSLNRSMALVLDEFYRNLRAVGVSAATGDGIESLFEAVDAAASDYERDYLPELKRRRAVAEAKERARQARDLSRLERDYGATRAAAVQQQQGPPLPPPPPAGPVAP